MIENYAETLAPRTTWQRFPSSRAIRQEGGLVDLGSYLQPGRDPLRVIVTVDCYDIAIGSLAGHWLHLSVSRERRLPTWADLCAARDALGYRERLFVQLVPPASAWLNMHSHCLHLLHRLDQETVPRELWDQHGADGSHYGKAGSIV